MELYTGIILSINVQKVINIKYIYIKKCYSFSGEYSKWDSKYIIILGNKNTSQTHEI